jgi:hypothetical protein
LDPEADGPVVSLLGFVVKCLLFSTFAVAVAKCCSASAWVGLAVGSGLSFMAALIRNQGDNDEGADEDEWDSGSDRDAVPSGDEGDSGDGGSG